MFEKNGPLPENQFRKTLVEYCSELKKIAPPREETGFSVIDSFDAEDVTIAVVKIDHRLWKKLTPRERQIAQYVGEQLSNRAIAEKLRISSNTVAVHKRRIFSKLAIPSSAYLIVLQELAKRQ